MHADGSKAGLEIDVGVDVGNNSVAVDVPDWVSVEVSFAGLDVAVCADVAVGIFVIVCDGVDCTTIGVGWSATAHAAITTDNRSVKMNALNRVYIGVFSPLFHYDH